MWLGIAIAIIGIMLVILICLIGGRRQPASREPIDEVYAAKVARLKEIDTQIKSLAKIAITTKDTLDKLRDEQDDLDEWVKAYEKLNKE